MLSKEWAVALESEVKKPYYQRLKAFLMEEYKRTCIFPPQEDIFNALKLTSISKVKVVILGQDPYHEPGQAHGLAFSVRKGVKIPPSLVNIYNELNEDIGVDIPKHGELTSWAKQGVLLLNTVLTVRRGEANSHKDKGWEEFTDRIIKIINEKQDPVVFMLWGSNAQAKTKLLNNPNHLVLKTTHPSPLSAYRGFLGCRHFSKANAFLEKNNIKPVNWQIQ